MTTTKPIGLEPTTRVEDMPPLHVTTTGIPAAEHIEEERTRTLTRQHRRDLLTWSIVGLCLLMFGLVTAIVYSPPTDARMGLSPYAWSQYRAGERATAPVTSTVLPTPASPFDGVPFTTITP